MIKPIITQQQVRLIIERDGKRIVDINMPKVDGCIDTDGFKHIESVTNAATMSIIIKAEV